MLEFSPGIQRCTKVEDCHKIPNHCICNIMLSFLGPKFKSYTSSHRLYYDADKGIEKRESQEAQAPSLQTISKLHGMPQNYHFLSSMYDSSLKKLLCTQRSTIYIEYVLNYQEICGPVSSMFTLKSKFLFSLIFETIYPQFHFFHIVP